jgi:predicted O-methyltransferase YrrM
MVRHLAGRARDLLARAAADERLGWLGLWLHAELVVPGWLSAPDAHRLYSLAGWGPERGAIVEIGSAWGRSTIFLARGSRRAWRERVYAVDPHTGDPDHLAATRQGTAFSTYAAFRRNLRRFGVRDWVTPILARSDEAAQGWAGGPIRLLYVDGLHTLAAVRDDIAGWVPRVTPGGVVVFDDYFTRRAGVGVRQAVDELVATGTVGPLRRGLGTHVWVRKR